MFVLIYSGIERLLMIGLHVRGDGGFLICGTWENVREATAGRELLVVLKTEGVEDRGVRNYLFKIRFGVETCLMIE